MKNFDKEIIEFNINTVFGLEYLGVHFEDTREEKDAYGFHSKTIFLFSIPESSTIELEDKELNTRIKTADELKRLTKEIIVDMMIKSFIAQFGEDKEFLDHIKDNTHDYFKFYAKVRSGETWNKELAEQRMKELNQELQEASGYREI